MHCIAMKSLQKPLMCSSPKRAYEIFIQFLTVHTRCIQEWNRMVWTLQWCHLLGEGLPSLPAGQNPPPSTGATATEKTGTQAQVQSHPRGLGRRNPPSISGFASTCSQPWTELPAGPKWSLSPPRQHSTVDCSNALFQRWWVSRFGIPAVSTSNRGPSCSTCSTSSTPWQQPYHPQSSGLVERFHRCCRQY